MVSRELAPLIWPSNQGLAAVLADDDELVTTVTESQST